MREIFWNPNEQRLRALWRILIMMAVFTLVVRGTSWLLRTLTGTRAALADTAPSEILRMVVMLVVLYLMARYVDKRRFSEYGLHLRRSSWWLDLGLSMLLTMLLISILFAVQVNMGWIVVRESIWGRGPVSVAGTMLFPLLNTIATAVYIELFFRGFMIVNLAEGFMFLRARYRPQPPNVGVSKVRLLLNSVWQRTPVLAAWLVATLVFLAFRVDFTMATNVLILNLLRASFLLTLPFILTRSIAIPIGLTLGWNFATRNIYGLKLIGGGVLAGEGSGVIESLRTLLVIVQSGPELLTGGSIGPEGGLLGMAAIVLAGMLVMLWIRQRYKPAASGRDVWTFIYEPVRA